MILALARAVRCRRAGLAAQEAAWSGRSALERTNVMTGNSNWLVVGFAREAGCQARIEVIMRAFDRRHADRLAAHFAAFGGAIVLAPDHNAQRPGFRVETQYGHVLPEELTALLRQRRSARVEIDRAGEAPLRAQCDGQYESESHCPPRIRPHREQSGRVLPRRSPSADARLNSVLI